MNQSLLIKAANHIADSQFTFAFTGAGISVESGVPPFRGEGGLWNQYDPKILELSYFYAHPLESWIAIKTIFYDFLIGKAPNAGHLTLTKWQNEGLLHTLVTQNIDNLHRKAGTQNVIDYHGNALQLVCNRCEHYETEVTSFLNTLPPLCSRCGHVLKPDFIFFGEGIPEKAYHQSIHDAQHADVLLVIGTSGEVSPANRVPFIAKENGAFIIEVNNDKSNYTNAITDIFLQGKAGEILPAIDAIIHQKPTL